MRHRDILLLTTPSEAEAHTVQVFNADWHGRPAEVVGVEGVKC